MNIDEFNEILKSIEDLNEDAMELSRVHCDNLIKPLSSLGVLEEIGIRLSGITGKIKNKTDRPAVIVMCADNGVYEEGVALTPQNVSALQTINTVRGKSGVAVLAQRAGADVLVYDVGLCADTVHPGIINKKVRYGAGNIAKEDAFSVDEALNTICAGIEAVNELNAKGINLIGAGEIGIGNTTTAGAIVTLYSGKGAEQIVGKGAGLSNSAYKHKIEVVKTAISRSKPDITNPIEVLCKIGGLDIAAMAGVFIGCAAKKIPAVIDGFISASAAIIAVALCEKVRNYLFASHASAEHGYLAAIEWLSLTPMFNLKMRLGEGSGCPLAFNVISSACDIFCNMGNFDDDLSEVTNAYLKTVDRDEQFDYSGI